MNTLRVDTGIEAASRLRDRLSLGGVAVQVYGNYESQYVSITPDGAVEMAITGTGIFDPAEVQTGLQLAGVIRRHHLRRRLALVEPTEIKVGDRLVLDDDQGERITTSKVKRLQIH